MGQVGGRTGQSAGSSLTHSLRRLHRHRIMSSSESLEALRVATRISAEQARLDELSDGAEVFSRIRERQAQRLMKSSPSAEPDMGHARECGDVEGPSNGE